MTITTGINGFGRIGLHLLKYWLDRAQTANFEITYINDEVLTLQDAFKIIATDRAVIFNKYKLFISGDTLNILEPNGKHHVIQYTNAQKLDIPWLGKPDIMLECSGRHTEKKDCDDYIKDNTKLVVISATSWDAEKTLIYGFNQKEYSKKLRVISYGSCTVDAYVPLASYLHQKYGVLDSDVNFIHNIQAYKMKDFYTLNRKFCTLEKSAPLLLPFLNEKNFIVNYTVVPYEGVSTLDFRLRLKRIVSREALLTDLQKSFSEGKLKHLYTMDEVDIGPEVYNCTTYSAAFIKENAKLLGNNLYLFGYFDNENSVNRYFDLVDYISSRWK